MIKITLYILLLIVMLLWLAETKVSFKPFMVTFEKGWFVVGLIFMAIGCGFMYHQAYMEGVCKGVDNATQYLLHKIDSIHQSEEFKH